MGKLHELLAVESDLASRANEALRSLKELFAQPQKFLGQVRKYRPLEENGRSQPDEITNMSTTVDEQVKDLFEAFSRWLNASLAKEVTNQNTGAELEINGKKYVLPAPALLNLEGKLAALRAVLDAIPTNDTTERWEWDAEAAVFVSAPRVTFRTEKVPKAIVLYEATKEHPAQVQPFTEDVRIGEWTTVIRSGMLQPSRKRNILNRLDAVITVVKQARQRANDIEATEVRLAGDVLSYIWE